MVALKIQKGRRRGRERKTGAEVKGGYEGRKAYGGGWYDTTSNIPILINVKAKLNLKLKIVY